MIAATRGPGRPSDGYRLADGSKVPSVTTVLGRFKDSGPLMQWAFRQGKEGAASLYEKRDEAGNVGSLVHDMIQADICGDPYPAIPDELALPVQQAHSAWESWADYNGLQIIATELPLVSEVFRFGGTIDAVGVIRDEHVLVDWKTSGGVYADYVLQLDAYRVLWEENNPDSPIRGFHLCRFAKDHGGFEHRYWPALTGSWDMFAHLLRAYDCERAVKSLV